MIAGRIGMTDECSLLLASVFSDDIRNDLYVTLIQGDLHGGKGSDKNIEARVCIVDTYGVVKDVNYVYYPFCCSLTHTTKFSCY